MGWVDIILATVGPVIGGVLGFILRDTYTRKRALIDASKQNILTFGAPVAIRVYGGTYVMADLNKDQNLTASFMHVEAWEKFEIVHPKDPFTAHPNRKIRYGDKVAFHARANNRFVGAALNRQCELVANAPEVRAWETFRLCSRHFIWPWQDKNVYYGSPIALQAHNRKYIMYNHNGDKRLLATVSHIRAWETFHFMRQDDPK